MSFFARSSLAGEESVTQHVLHPLFGVEAGSTQEFLDPTLPGQLGQDRAA